MPAGRQVALESQIDEANRSRVALERLLTEVRPGQKNLAQNYVRAESVRHRARRDRAAQLTEFWPRSSKHLQTNSQFWCICSRPGLQLWVRESSSPALGGARSNVKLSASQLRL